MGFSKIKNLIIKIVLVVLFLTYCIITQDVLGVFCGVFIIGLFFYIEHQSKKSSKNKEDFR